MCSFLADGLSLPICEDEWLESVKMAFQRSWKQKASGFPNPDSLEGHIIFLYHGPTGFIFEEGPKHTNE